MIYVTKDGKLAYVAPGSAGNFTFYLRLIDKPRTKGKRIRGRGQSLWYPSQAAAETALADYASKRGWRQQGVEL